MTTATLNDTNGLVFGGHGNPGTTDLIIDVDRDKDITVLTLGRATFTHGSEDVPVETTGQIRLTPGEVDLLVFWMIEHSAGQRYRVDDDLWGHMMEKRRRVYSEGGRPTPADDAWATDQLQMRKQLPSHPDDMPGLKLRVAAYSGEAAAQEAYDRHVADRAARCAEAVRRVLADAEPLTFREIIGHPEWRPDEIHENDWGLAASLADVLRSGVEEGWLVRWTRGSVSRWSLADGATS